MEPMLPHGSVCMVPAQPQNLVDFNLLVLIMKAGKFVFRWYNMVCNSFSSIITVIQHFSRRKRFVGKLKMLDFKPL